MLEEQSGDDLQLAAAEIGQTKIYVITPAEAISVAISHHAKETPAVIPARVH